MKIKFNWGTGILIAIILIFSGVISFYIYISRLDNNLVEDDYYEKELVYEKRIEKIRNMEALPGRISLTDEGDRLIVEFPGIIKGKKPEGTLLFYRPSNQKMDITIPIQLNDSAIQVVDASGLAGGRYILKIDWSLDGVEYYQEESLVRNEK